MVGCSGSQYGEISEDPISPDPQLTGEGTTDRDTSTTQPLIFEIGELIVDPESGTVTAVPIRGADFTCNVLKFLQPPGGPSSITGLEDPHFDYDDDFVYVDMTCGITHPFPDTAYWGFDVRLIFFGSGDGIRGKHDPSIRYPAPDDFRLTNADGYTRWFNFNEFSPIDSVDRIWSYIEGEYAMSFGGPFCDINGYKYFADGVYPVMMPPNPPPAKRGLFPAIADRTFSRQLVIRYPGTSATEFRFKYSVAGSYAFPTHRPPRNVNDFPPHANQPEAYQIVVTQGPDSTVCYDPDTGDGSGDLVLDIEIFDWQGDGDVPGEISAVYLESPTLFDGQIQIKGNSSWSGMHTSEDSYMFSGTIHDVTPDGFENQELFITVEVAEEMGYEPPFSGFNCADGRLAAYQLLEVEVGECGPPPKITVIAPNGGEEWCIGDTETIEWTSQNVSGAVNLEYTIDGGTNWLGIDGYTENDEEYPWPIPDTTSENAKVRISSVLMPWVKDESDEVFTIKECDGHPEVTMTSCPSTPPPVSSWTFTWDMSDDETPTEELEVTVYLDGDPIELEPGTTEYHWSNIHCPNHTFEVEVTDEDGNTKTASCSPFDGVDDPPYDVEINCPTDPVCSWTFTWTMEDDCTDKADLGVEIRRDSTDENDWEPRPDGSTSFPWDNIPPGNHTFEVRVTDGAGQSTEAEPCPFECSDGAPDPPDNVEASDGEFCDYVEICWDPVEDADSYKIYRNNTLVKSNASCCCWNDTTADPGIHYDYQVSAVNENGESAKSTADVGWRKAPPAAPQDVEASDGEFCEYVEICWDSVSGAASYRIYRNGDLIKSNASCCCWNDTTPGPGIHYNYAVSAVNECGESPKTSDEGWRKTDPDPPENVEASDGEFCDYVEICWDSVSEATSYRIYRNGGLIKSNASSCCWNDTTASPGIHYNYQVSAVNECGEGSKSSSDEGWRNAVPDPPTGVLASNGSYSDKVRITWNLVSEASIYKIYRDGDYIGSDTSSPYDDYPPECGTHYGYQVSAVNACGEGSKSPSDEGWCDDCAGDETGPSLSWIWPNPPDDNHPCISITDPNFITYHCDFLGEVEVSASDTSGVEWVQLNDSNLCFSEKDYSAPYEFEWDMSPECSNRFHHALYAVAQDNCGNQNSIGQDLYCFHSYGWPSCNPSIPWGECWDSWYSIYDYEALCGRFCRSGNVCAVDADSNHCRIDSNSIEGGTVIWEFYLDPRWDRRFMESIAFEGMNQLLSSASYVQYRIYNFSTDDWDVVGYGDNGFFGPFVVDPEDYIAPDSTRKIAVSVHVPNGTPAGQIVKVHLVGLILVD